MLPSSFSGVFKGSQISRTSFSLKLKKYYAIKNWELLDYCYYLEQSLISVSKILQVIDCKITHQKVPIKLLCFMHYVEMPT